MGAAAAAGIDTITLTDDQADTITIGSGFSNALTINVASDANAGDTITATNYTGALTVNADDSELDTNALTLTGGSGSDTLAITLTADTTILTSGVTNVETITLTGDDGGTDTATITTADGLVADGASLTINGAGLDQANNDAILTFDGSAEADGTFTITTAGGGAHTITLGQQ